VVDAVRNPIQTAKAGWEGTKVAFQGAKIAVKETFEGGAKQTAKRAWEFTKERLNPFNYERDSWNVNFKGGNSSSTSWQLNKNIRQDAWRGDFGKIGDGYAQRVKDLPKWDPMRTKFARMLKEIRTEGMPIGKHSNEAAIAGFGGESLKEGVWFRWNPEKVRVVDMIEETIHWEQIKSNLLVKGYTPEALEIMAKRSIINNYDIGNSLKYELLDDIKRVNEGSYITAR
jgi:hypothetical protein